MTETSRRRGRIDVQFHFSPAFYTDRVDEAGGHITTDRWSVDALVSVSFVDPVEVH